MGGPSYWKAFGSAGTGADQLSGPAATATDSRGRSYVVDQGNSRIVRIDDMIGTNWIFFGSQGLEDNQFCGPLGIAVDKSGRVYVADPENNRIERFDDMTGTNWATIGTYGSGTGQGLPELGGIARRQRQGLRRRHEECTDRAVHLAVAASDGAGD